MGNTKASVLQFLIPRLRTAIVDKHLVMTIGRWQDQQNSLIAEISATFSGPVIVRSSAIDEDQDELASTGKYRSVQFVDPQDPEKLRTAVCAVIVSYEAKGNYNLENELIIQHQVTDPLIAGVVFTRHLKNNTPYYLIEYNETGKTDAVTGYGQRRRNVIFRRGLLSINRHKKFGMLLEAVAEIEQLLANDCLIVEFAITADQQIHVFQARSIPLAPMNFSNTDYQACLLDTQLEIGNMTLDGSVFSNMADWNPAEMLGSYPAPFAISLYRTLITDDAWHAARTNLGYKPTPFNLMSIIGARPYINMQHSLYSLLPAAFSSDLAARVVQQQLRQVELDPALHDKIEFKVAIGADSFSKTRLQKSLSEDYGLAMVDDAVDTWFSFNRNLISLARGKIKILPAVIGKLKAFESEFKAAVTAWTPRSLAAALERLKILGVVPFAELARLAFWAKTFLYWLRLENALDNADYTLFFEGIKASAFGQYEGVLRPNTYDIASLPYPVSPSPVTRTSAVGDTIHQMLAQQPISRLTGQFLSECESTVSKQDFLEMLHQAIHYREVMKFQFTQSLSAIIEAYAKWGAEHGLNRQTLALFTITEMNDLQERTGELKRIAVLKSLICHKYQGIILPAVITRDTDLMNFEITSAKPNYITKAQVSGQPVYLDVASERDGSRLLGKIVVIEAADPGYDWIFSHDIKGLITKYGGMGSHMAIRCHEYRICAAIGCGEVIFEQLLGAHEIVIDAEQELVYCKLR